MPEKSILIADDERMIREYFSAVLEKYDVTVTAVETGEEAAAQVAQKRFDLIISDIQMPGMSGVELTRRIRQSDQETPIILITGAATDEMIKEGTSFGAYILRKPMRVEEIMRAVETVLGIKPVR